MIERGKKNVLVVEDEKALAQALEIKLLQEGYRVDVAGNGQVALETIARAKPGVILLDLIMPVMDGVDFLKALRVEQGSKIPVLILTVMISGILFDQCKTLGVNDFLVKDQTSLDEVVKKVREVAGNP